MSLRLFPVMLLLLFVVGCAAEESKVVPELKLDTPKSRISYTIGVNIGQDFKTQKMDVDADILVMGLKDSMAGKELRLTDEEMATEIQTFQETMQAKMAAEMEALETMDPLEIKAWQYDIVCNGYELSSGAIRIFTTTWRGSLPRCAPASTPASLT